VTSVTFIDTSVLCELLQVPGKSQRPVEIRAELEERTARGEQFVIPVTALIETGNHIAHASGDRYAAAQRLCGLIAAAVGESTAFRLHEFAWNGEFMRSICNGGATQQTYDQWAAAGQMGTGDLAILVERDRFIQNTAFSRNDVGIWTLEAVLGAFA
jgi:hypothetical protein